MPLHDKENTCPLCGQEAQKTTLGNDDVRVVCQRCGDYQLTHEFFTYTGLEKNIIQRIKGGDPDSEDILIPLHELQGIIYERNLDHIQPYIGWSPNEKWLTLKQLVATLAIPKKPLEKIDKLLGNLAKMSRSDFGAVLTLGEETHKKLAYAKTPTEFLFLLENALELGYLERVSGVGPNGQPRFKIWLKGWQRIEEIEEENKDSKQGFIAHWFGLDPSYIEAMEKGVDAAGFKPLSLKGKNYPETVLSKALGEINRSRFVVVDLTGQRPSVFIEAGYTLGRGIQTILVIERKYWEANKKDLEFYLTNYNIKQYSSPEELSEIVETAIRERIF